MAVHVYLGGVGIESRVRELENEARTLRGKWVPTWWERKRNETKAKFYEELAQEISRGWDKGERTIAVAAHDKIVGTCSEVQRLRSQACEVEIQLTLRNEELERLKRLQEQRTFQK